MKLLFLGDVVGRSGRNVVQAELPGLIERCGYDFVVANGENAAGGFGITEAILHDLMDCGVDAVTLGNHAWDQREALVFIERAPNLIRPINFPAGTPGSGASILSAKSGARVMVINALGRIFMQALDDPFAAVEAALEGHTLGDSIDAVLIDFHAEATSEKLAFGYQFDGQATLVVGTHTHVPTADARILPGGTAYLSDAGMCGDYDSIIGMKKHEPMNRFRTGISSGRFEAADGPATLCGVGVETDGSGRAVNIETIRIGGVLDAAGG
ncbi:MAG: TIGR00282 family metallophosphoesterase [Pseudomonadota bacterium]